MTTRLKLKPGSKGTKKLVQQYGEALVCVRYRYDAVSQKRIKTAEIIIEEKSWTPPPPKLSATELVPVRIEFSETKLKQMAKEAGGRWVPNARVWFISYGKVKGTILEKHILLDAKTK